MLARGFKDQICEIFKCLTPTIQVCVLTSADGAASEVHDMQANFLRNAVFVTQWAHMASLDGVQQYYIEIEKEEWKLDTVCDLFECLTITQAIVYCNTRRKADFVHEQLQRRDFNVACLNAQFDARERDS